MKVNIRFTGKLDRKDLDSAFRIITLGIYKDVILGTPVDTGRARANWQLALGRIPGGEINKKDKARSGSMSGHASSSIREGDKKVKTVHRAGNSVFIANNVSYIGLLEEGYSKQASGFVQNAIDRAQQRMLAFD